jgi:mannosyltransferase OCH1-like enzyme
VGGIYSDLDSICIQPIRDWLPDLSTSNRNVLVLDLDLNQKWFCQWTIASTPNHPAMRYVCNYVLQKWKKKSGFPKKKDGSIHVLHATGPAIFTSAIKQYLAEPDSTAHDIYKKYIRHKHYRARLNKLGIFISPTGFFLGGGSKNLFGSAHFGNGYNSWSQEAQKLADQSK